MMKSSTTHLNQPIDQPYWTGCWLAIVLSLLGVIAPSWASDDRRVWLETTHGPILLALEPDRAPITTKNFIDYVNGGFYDGLIFHRVVPGFVIQSGAYTRQLDFRAPTSGTIKGEASNGLANDAYTIAMGLVGGNPDSAQAQFYINVGNNNYLDGDYTVFGRVLAGQKTVDRINQVRTTSDEVPLELPMIIHAVETQGYPLMPLHTGSWYNEATSGTGFNLEITHDASTESGPLAVIYWYDFDKGEQIWLTGVKSFSWGDHQITLELITASSPVANADFRQPPEGDAFETWGTLTIEFISCRQGQVTYDSPSRGRAVIDVVRLTLPTTASCQSL